MQHASNPRDGKAPEPCTDLALEKQVMANLTTVDLRTAGRHAVLKLYFCGNQTIRTVTMPDVTEAMRVGTFSSCPSLRFVNMSGCTRMKSIPAYAFASSGCRSGLDVALPPFLDDIGIEAFSASTVRAVCLPSTVTHVGSLAFHSCRRLGSVELCGDEPPVLETSAFGKAPVTVSASPGCIQKLCGHDWFSVKGRELRRRCMERLLLIQRLVDVAHFRAAHLGRVTGTIRGVRDSEVTKARRNKNRSADPGLSLPRVPIEIWMKIFDASPGWVCPSRTRKYALQTWTTKWRMDYGMAECFNSGWRPLLLDFLNKLSRGALEKLCNACGYDIGGLWRVRSLAQMVCESRCGKGGIVRLGRRCQEKHVEWAKRIISTQ